MGGWKPLFIGMTQDQYQRKEEFRSDLRRQARTWAIEERALGTNDPWTVREDSEGMGVCEAEREVERLNDFHVNGKEYRARPSGV